MQVLLQNVRYSLRRLRKTPGFTAEVFLILAFGIAASTAIFSLVNAILLRPLPYKQPDQLVALWEKNVQVNKPKEPVTPANYKDWKEQSKSFEEIGAARDRAYNLTGDGEPEAVLGYRVSTNFFHMLGVEPVVGADFAPGSDQPGRDNVVLLSHRLWQRRFGSAPNVIGP